MVDFVFRLVCKADPNAVSSFEEALFPVFQGILQADVLGKSDLPYCPKLEAFIMCKI